MAVSSDDTSIDPQPTDTLRAKVEEFRQSPHSGRLFRELRDELHKRGIMDTLAEVHEIRAANDSRHGAELWAEAAQIWFAAGIHDRGHRALDEALRLDPAHERAATVLADMYIEAGRYAEAVDLIEEELEELRRRDEGSGEGVAPQHGARRAERHRLLAHLWNERLGRVDRALTHWQQAWRLEPERTDALEAARLIYATLGDDKMLARLYEAELEVLGEQGQRKRRSEIELELGRIAAKQGDALAAAGHCEVALRLDQASLAVREALVNIYASPDFAGKPDQQERAAELLVELGERRLENQEEKAGIGFLRRALEINPSSRRVFDALEQALAATERWEELDRLYKHQLDVIVPESQDRFQILHKRAHLYETQLDNRKVLKEILVALAAEEPPHSDSSQRLRGLYRDQEDWAALAAHIEAELPAIRDNRQKTCAEMLELATIVREHLGERDRAAAILHSILQDIDSRNEEALARYGEHFRERRDWRGLADLLDFAVNNARDAGAEVSELVRQLEEIAEIAERRLGDLDRAINTWQRIQALEPDSAKPAESIRRLMSRAKMWESLVGVLEQEAQVAQTPEQRAEALRRIAQVYREHQVNPRRAIALYEEVMTLFPDDRGVLKVLTELYEREGDHAGLARTMRRQLDLEARAMGAADVLRPNAREWPVAQRSERLTALRRLMSMYQRLKDTEGVVFACTGILEILPGDRDSLDRMEQALEKAGDTERLEQTLEYHASSASGPAERSKVLRRLARIALQGNDEARALQRWENVLTAAPNDAEALENLADLYERQGRWADLAMVLERILMPHRRAGTQSSVRRAATDSGFRSRTKRARTRAGTHSASVDASSLPDLDTRVGQLKRYARVVDEKLSDAARAITAWQQIVDLVPTEGEALQALARLYEEHGYWRELAEVLGLQASLYRSTNPFDGPRAGATVALKRAELFENRLGSPADAVKVLEELITDLDPANLEAHERLRRLYESLSDFEAAVRIAERQMYLTTDPGQKIARGMEIGAMCRDRLGDAHRALQAFVRVLGLHADNEEALAAAAELYAHVGDWNNHLKALEALIELASPGHARRDIMFRMGQVIAERLGDPRSAFAWYRKAHEHAPDDSTLAELRRAAEDYGLWTELAEVYDHERSRLESAGAPMDVHGYAAVCRELAAIAERELGDAKRAMNVLYDAIVVQPRDSGLLAEAERLAREADDRALWSLLLECIAAAIDGADRMGRVTLHNRRARILESEMQNPSGAFEELLQAFSWMPEREETLKALYELGERTGEWNDVIAAESALLERATATRARITILRRKAGVLENKLKEPVRAFRTHLQAFLLAPADNNTVSHMWRLARQIGTYAPSDQTPRAEPPAAYVHPHDSGRMAAPKPPLPTARRAQQVPLDVRGSKALREDATMDLSLDDLQALRVSQARPQRGDPTMDLSASDLRALRVGTDPSQPPQSNFDSGDITQQLDVLDVEAEDSVDIELGDASSERLTDATIELSINDLMLARGREKPAAAGKPPTPPPVSPSGNRPPPPPKRTPPPPRSAAAPAKPTPLPVMPYRPYISPWEEMAVAYELLPAPSTESKQRCLFRVAEVWENGAADIGRAFNTLARALELGIDDAEVRARLHRLATDHNAWDRLAELYETAAEEAKTADQAISLLMDVAEIRVGQKRGREAETLYRRVLGMRPDDLAVRQRLEALYRAENRWVDLAASLEERTDPRLGTAAPESERADLLRELADIYSKQLQRPHDAIDALHRLQTLAPEDVGVLRELSELYGQIGRWSKVIEMLNRVGEIAEGTPAARDALRRIAQIYESELELPERAIVAYSQLVAAWPDDTEAHAALDKLYEAHARWNDLAEILRRRAALSRDTGQRAHLLRRRAAVLLHKLNAAEEAAAALRHARTLTPDAPGLADELVHALIGAGREREAASVLESRIEAQKSAGAGQDGSAGDIAALMIRLATLKAERLGDPQGAKQYLERALRMVPDHPTALATLAKIIESEEDPRIYAEARLREAEALSDLDAKVEALMKAGTTLRDRCNDIDAARDAFERVLKVRPYHPDAIWALAGLVEQGGDPHQAAQVLETRLEDETLDEEEKARIMTQLAALARQAGVEAAAERHLMTALEAVPTHVPAIMARADLLAESERFEDLAAFLSEIVPTLAEVPPATLTEIHRRLALAYEELGRDDDAYQTLLDADRLHRGNLLVKLALGENRYRARRWREAALHLSSLAMHVDARSYPAEVAEGLYHAALAEIRSLRPEKARALYERAVDLKPNYAPALHALAELAMEEGEYRKAADFLARQANSTEDPSERMRLFEALGDMTMEVLGDQTRAMQCYEAAVNSASPLESRHLPLLEKLLARQDAAGDQGGAARTAELMASFATDGAARAAHYTRAAESYLAAGDKERAMAAATRAVEASAYELAGVNILSELLMARGEADEAAAVLGRALSGPDSADDEIVAARKSQLWNRLGHARKARGDHKGAATAWEKSVALAGDSDSAMDSRRELILAWTDFADKRDQLLEFRRVLAADTMSLKDVVNYARALCQAKHDDGGRAILDLATAMGHSLNKLDQSFLERRPVYQMAADEAYRRPVSEELHRELVLGRHHGQDEDDMDDVLAQILTALWDAASLLWPDPEDALERSGVAGATRVQSFSNLAAAAIFPCIAAALNVPATVLYTSSLPDAPDVQVVCVSAPIVIVGPRLQVPVGHKPAPGSDQPTSAELRFLLGRAAEMVRPRHVIAAGLSYPDFVNLLSSALRCFAPKHLRDAIRGDIFDEDVQRVHDENLRSTLPVKLRTRLEELLQDATSRGLDPDRYLDDLVRAADRAGFLMCGDIATAMSHAGHMSADGRRITRHITETALRPGYLPARTALGVGVR